MPPAAFPSWDIRPRDVSLGIFPRETGTLIHSVATQAPLAARSNEGTRRPEAIGQCPSSGLHLSWSVRRGSRSLVAASPTLGELVECFLPVDGVERCGVPWGAGGAACRPSPMFLGRDGSRAGEMPRIAAPSAPGPCRRCPLSKIFCPCHAPSDCDRSKPPLGACRPQKRPSRGGSFSCWSGCCYETTEKMPGTAQLPAGGLRSRRFCRT